MVEQDRTCYLWNRSRVSYLETIEAVSRLILYSFSDDEITTFCFYKRTAMAGNRTLDLSSRGPAWSHGAMEAQGCSDVFSEVEFTFIGWPIIVVTQ